MKLEFTGLNQILEFILYLNKTEIFTVPNKVLLVMGQRTSGHCEDYS